MMSTSGRSMEWRMRVETLPTAVALVTACAIYVPCRNREVMQVVLVLLSVNKAYMPGVSPSLVGL